MNGNKSPLALSLSKGEQEKMNTVYGSTGSHERQ
jgi:hypothetical protein